MFADQEKPVTSPGNIPRDRPEAFNVHADPRSQTVTGDVFERDPVVPVELKRDDTDRRLQPVAAGLDSAQMGQRHGYAHRPVTAHSQATNIVEEDDSRHTARV